MGLNEGSIEYRSNDDDPMDGGDRRDGETGPSFLHQVPTTMSPWRGLAQRSNVIPIQCPCWTCAEPLLLGAATSFVLEDDTSGDILEVSNELNPQYTFIGNNSDGFEPNELAKALDQKLGSEDVLQNVAESIDIEDFESMDDAAEVRSNRWPGMYRCMFTTPEISGAAPPNTGAEAFSEWSS